MSPMRLLNIRSTLLAMLDVCAFFCVLSFAYLVAAMGLYFVGAMIFGAFRVDQITAVGGWFLAVPGWVWILIFGGYVVLLTVYWAPGDDDINRAELRAGVIFFVVVILALVVWANAEWEIISNLRDWL